REARAGMPFRRAGQGSRTGGLSVQGRLPENVMHFARLLRAAGLRVGSDRVIDCVRALEIAGAHQFPLRRDDWYWTMSAVLLSRQEQRPIFDQAFRIFWRDPKLAERMMSLLLPQAHGRAAKPEEQQSQRLTDALFSQKEEAQETEKLELEARLTFSSREVLSRMDFDTMSAAELAEAKKMLAQLRLPLPLIRTRRKRMSPKGKAIDLRATLRESLREGGEVIALVRTAPRTLHPPLVVLCDISGSMNPYSRMFLHFLHAITNDRDRVSVFVFGTRLTNITRQLRHRDVDVAMTKVADAIKDWSGGTRIGASLREFNYKWGRRVLAQNASVLLVSDGLDREAGEGLAEEMERLAKSCRQLVWLNPLLRYDKFEARPAGVRAMLPHVDLFLPVHNLKSLVDLARTLSAPIKEKPQWR
ncbi:MAG TPA: VWA domain-containing protein, partial [Burkholderiales bacterium]|nr:VWA domain-containing protein [Burkholderiales bacterium]